MSRQSMSSPAMVVAIIALVFALGGGAYAALKLPRNSVTTREVKDRSLLAKDFKKGQLPAGAAEALNQSDHRRVPVTGVNRVHRVAGGGPLPTGGR